MDEYEMEEQLKRIDLVLDQMLKDKKNLNDALYDTDYLKKYLNDRDIIFFRDCIKSYLGKNTKNVKYQLRCKVVTPYSILGIEEKEYTKEELLDIVKQRVNFINKHGINKVKIKKEIDKILDAYNELTKASNKKK